MDKSRRRSSFLLGPKLLGGRAMDCVFRAQCAPTLTYSSGRQYLRLLRQEASTELCRHELSSHLQRERLYT